MKNSEIADIFDDIADLLELKGENKFKIRAYARGAEIIRHLPEELESMLAAGRKLTGIPGIGEAIANKSKELITTGRLQYYEELKESLPAGVIDLLNVPGIGPRTANRLYAELGITSIDELEKAINNGRVAELERMGQKTASNILHSIEAYRRKDTRTLLGVALPAVEEIVAALKEVPGAMNITPAGSLRRLKETVGDIDIMGTADDPGAVVSAFVKLPCVNEVLSHGSTKASVILSGGLQADLRIVEHDSFGSLLQHFTGSREHNIALRSRAQKLGLSLSEYGITDIKTGEIKKFTDEAAFYGFMGLQFIPPELREDMGEIEAAEKGVIPRLIELGDIRGDLHMHSVCSDGNNTIAEMAEAARALGYEYIAITDHSSGRNVPIERKFERVREQSAEIRKLNKQMQGIHLLNGVEVDIRADGSLDLPDEILAELDIVIAAVHSSFVQPREVMTRRVVGVLENPHVDVIAHPTGRKIGEREPIDIDFDAVLDTAGKYGKALEINAMPDRLDLRDSLAYRARQRGVMLVLGTDAHAEGHLGLMRLAVGVARRAWCEPAHVLNTRRLPDLLSFLHRS